MSKIAIRNIALYIDKRRVDIKRGEPLPEGVSAADLTQLERLQAIGDAPAAPVETARAAPKTSKAKE
ncbi:MAG: hypothetical protein LBQ81_12200 [Zoogloeaceae bacterium]|jgi:hypothetical protein|nr:hypothetical protein [Zoogloeaceae bacterium]